ncbi:MAG: glycosyltransferase [Planctomycetes bacterium]|nr:glycosyltransferase [Planctomycetota bacterium]
MRILFLISDTGGGHRAAANAIAEALRLARPNVTIEIVDALVEGCPWPLRRAPQIYAFAMKHLRWMWALFFHLSNGPWRARISSDLGYPFNARGLRRVLRDHPADLVVSTHPLLTRQVLHALNANGNRPPFAVVVTDLVSGHWTWYESGVDLFCVPTEGAKTVMVSGGIAGAKIHVCGQPVAARLAALRAQRESLRAERGLTQPTVLLLGGGDGTGGLGTFARALAAAQLGIRIVVVCARNAALKTELDNANLGPNVTVLGFVKDLPEWMAASDLLVTKGGPGSLMEGCAAGLPMIVYDWIPGQEIGNVRLAQERGFGRVATKPAQLVNEVRALIADQVAMERMRAAALVAAVPDASARIAATLLTLTRE